MSSSTALGDAGKSDVTAICSFEYQRTAAGDPASILREDGGYTYYQYDALHRLAGEEQFDSDDTSLHAFGYTYDPAGNRLTKTFNGAETAYQYNTLNQLEWKATEGEYTYYHFDAGGNQVAKQEGSGTTYYQYDHENLMTQIDFADGSHNYFAWDADSKRVAADEEQISEFEELRQAIGRRAGLTT